MIINGMWVRWIYAACYEIRLADGTAILVDPFFTAPLGKETFCLDNIGHIDYVLITHSHNDHILDLKELDDRDHPKIIASGEILYSLARGLDLNYDDLYPITPNECLRFPEFTLNSYRAKHTLFHRADCRPSCLQDLTVKKYGGNENANLGGCSHEGLNDCDQLGFLDSMDYVITARNNLRLYFSSGIHAFDNAFEIAGNMAPNIVIRQSGTLTDPEAAVKELARYGAQLFLPFHHENLGRKKGIDADALFAAIDEKLRQVMPGSRFVNPRQFNWYGIGMEVVLTESARPGEEPPACSRKWRDCNA